MTKSKITLLLTILFFTLLPISAENKFEVMPVKKIEANPINIAVMLTEQLDSASSAATCEYYGYVNQSSEDGFTIFKHPNGSIIRFNFITADNGKKYPTVEVKSKGSQKDKDRNLKSLISIRLAVFSKEIPLGLLPNAYQLPKVFSNLNPSQKPNRNKAMTRPEDTYPHIHTYSPPACHRFCNCPIA